MSGMTVLFQNGYHALGLRQSNFYLNIGQYWESYRDMCTKGDERASLL